MRGKLWCVAALAIGAALWVAPARAQTDGSSPAASSADSDDNRSNWDNFWQFIRHGPKNVRLSIGTFHPYSGLFPQPDASYWTTAGISVETHRPTTRHPYAVSNFFEGMATDRTSSGPSRNEIWEVYGMGTEVRGYVGTASWVSFYSGVGAGVYMLRRSLHYGQCFKLMDYGCDLIEDHAALRPGIKLMGGIEERHGVFFEMRYFDAGSFEGVPYKGVLGYLGARF